MQGSVHSYDEAGPSGEVILDDGRVLAFAPAALLGSGLLHLRVGQRVSLALADDPPRVTRVWIVGIGDGEAIR